MKGLAFAYDPDGYWVELVKREQSSEDAPDFALSQTMLRGKSSLALANSTHTHTTPFLSISDFQGVVLTQTLFILFPSMCSHFILEKTTTTTTVKDAKKSLEFYTSVMGMQLVAERHYGPEKGDFSLYFLCNKNDVGPDVPKDPTDPEVRISRCFWLVR